MKIYTKTGDDGKTHLLGGARVEKSQPRVECYGNIDELNASLGWVAVATEGQSSWIDPLRAIQNDLFVIGSHLAVPDAATAPSTLPPLDETMVSRLETQIDSAEAQLPPLRNFVLPGGSELGGRMHLTRTMCRRAERQIVRFALDCPVPPVIITYLNRLSDWLFVHARLANQQAGVADIPWHAK